MDQYEKQVLRDVAENRDVPSLERFEALDRIYGRWPVPESEYKPFWAQDIREIMYFFVKCVLAMVPAALLAFFLYACIVILSSFVMQLLG